MAGQEFSSLLEEVAEQNDADLYLFSGPVVPKSERRFNNTLRKNKRRANAVCLTTTYGGSADVAYQLVRSVRRHYAEGDFILFVDSLCKSAGTLIAVGADSIVMSDTAELGPLDVQVLKPGEMGEFISGLTPKQALATLRDSLFDAFEFCFLNLRVRSQGQISTRMAAEMAVKMAVGSYRPIYQQFDPMRLGENERSVEIARAYGERIKTENLKADAIEQLINGYPSHGFVIDRDEAADLFHRVRAPTDAELALADHLRGPNQEALFADAPIIRCLRSRRRTDEESNQPENDNSEAAQGPSGIQEGEQHSAVAELAGNSSPGHYATQDG